MKQIEIKAELDRSELDKELKELEKESHSVKVGVDGDNVDDAEKSMEQLNKTTTTTTSTFEKLKKKVNETFSGGKVAMTAYLAVLNSIRTAAKEAQQTITELDESVTDLSIAMGSSRDTATEYLASLNKMAKELGATTKETAEAADNWLRQGKTEAETEELIADSMILSKLGKIESAEATEYLTSALNGYNLEAKDAIDVVDKLTAVDMVSASDAGGLAESLSKAASAANMAGVSFEKLIGYAATIKEVTQDSDESVGNSLKSILARMNQIKAGKFIDEETGEALNDVEKVLNKVGISMRDANNEFLDSEVILDEVGAKWSEFDATTQRAVATAMAGTYQYNKAITLFNNYSTALEYAEVATNSAGTAMEKFETSYLDSLEAKTNSLQASFESLVMNSDLTEVTGGVIDATNALVQFIDKTNLLNGVLTGAAFAGTIKAFTSLRTGILNAYTSLNKFNSALNIVSTSTAKISTSGFQQLLQLSNSLSTSQMKLVISTDALSVSQKKQLLMASGLSAEEATLQMETWGMTAAETSATAATTSLSAAVKGLGASVKSFIVANKWAVALAAVATAAYSVYKAYDALTVSVKEANDAMDEAVSSYESAQSELESLTSELEENQKQLDELLAKSGTLTYAEQGQLEELQAITKELQVQEEIAERNASKAAKEAAESTVDAYNTQYGDYDFSAERIDRITADATSAGTNAFVFSEGDYDLAPAIAQLKMTQELLDKTEEKMLNTEGMTEDEIKSLEEDFQYYVDTIDEQEELLDTSLSDLVDKQSNLQSGYTEAVQKQLSGEILTSSEKEIISTYEDISNAIKLIYQYTDASAWNSIEFDSIFNTEGIEKTKDELIAMAQAGELNIETIASEYPKLNEAIENSNFILKDGQTAAQAFCNEISACADEVETLSDSTASVTTALSISETIDNLNTQLKPAFDSLKSAYQDIFTDDGFTLDNVDLSMLETIKSDLDDLNELDGITIDYSAFEDFAKVLTDTSSTEEQVHESFNELATDIVNSLNPALSECSGESYQLVKQMLESLGVQNSEEVMIAALGYSYEEYTAAKEEAKAAGVDLETATEEEVYALVQEKLATDECGSALALFQLKKLLVNDTPLDTSEEIEYLLSLANAAGVSADSLSLLAEAYPILIEAMESGDSVRIRAAENILNKVKGEINAAIDAAKTATIEFEPPSTSNSGSSSSSSSSSSSDDNDDYLDEYEERKEALQDMLDQGKISNKEYLDELRELYSEFFADLEEYSDKYEEETYEYLEGMKTLYEDAFSAAINKIDDLIDKYEEQKDAATSSYTAQKEAAEAAYQAQIDAIQETIDAIDDEIASKEKAIDRIQAEIDAIKAAREERELLYTIQQKQYALEQAKNQRTNLVYEDGQMVYEVDTSAIKDAEDELDDAETDLQTSKLEAQIDAIEREIDLLEEQKDDLEAQQDAIEALIDASNEYFDSLIEAMEEQFDELIDHLDGYKSRWEELSDLEEEALEQAKLQEVLDSIGVSEEDLLTMTETEFENLKLTYASLLKEMYSGNDAVLGQLSELTGFDMSEMNGYLTETTDAFSILTGIDLTNAINSAADLETGLMSVSDAASQVATMLAGGAKDEEGSAMAVANADTSSSKKSNGSTASSSSSGGSTLVSALEQVQTTGTETTQSLQDNLLLTAEVGDEANQSLQEGFDETTATIESVIGKVFELISALQSLSSTSVSVNIGGSSSGYAEGTVGNAFAKGTTGRAFAKGYKGLRHSEKNALRSEYGQEELTVYPNGQYEITTEPTMSDLPKDTVIFNNEQTKKILDGSGTLTGVAHADGTDTAMFAGKMRTADEVMELSRAFAAQLANINPLLNEMNKSMAEQVKTINTNNITNNSQRNQTINQSFNITMPNVTNSTSAEALMRDLQSLSVKKFQYFG